MLGGRASGSEHITAVYGMCAAETSAPVRDGAGNADVQVTNKVEGQWKCKKVKLRMLLPEVRRLSSLLWSENRKEQKGDQQQRPQQSQERRLIPPKASKRKKPAENHGSAGAGLKTSAVPAPVPAATCKYKRLPVDSAHSTAWQGKGVCISRPAGWQP